jgi:hypothetical protein
MLFNPMIEGHKRILSLYHLRKQVSYFLVVILAFGQHVEAGYVHYNSLFDIVTFGGDRSCHIERDRRLFIR